LNITAIFKKSIVFSNKNIAFLNISVKRMILNYELKMEDYDISLITAITSK